MIYDIVLRLSYSYANPATGGRHLARLMPVDLPGEQRLVAAQLDIAPAPSERSERSDFFGNRATDFAYRGAFSKVALTVRARVDRLVPPLHGPALLLAELPRALAGVKAMTPNAPVHFRTASPFVPLVPEVSTYALAQTTPGMTALAAVAALGQALHRDMRYDPEATDVDTPMAKAFAARHGVCQDFSHIMIAGLRGLGIPAGYVSGLLRTTPPPGKPRLEGADAMHAWVRAWCGPQVGWVEYDPTNAAFAGETHIVVARGRDYSDVSPIKGVLRVSGSQSGQHSVDVKPLTGRH
jgi:transglutaminase-like putative cysteine protease